MSDLLNKASLVMVPSGYKEDTVYSVVPSDGSGDLSFTRASNGTRINSAGLVEVTPWNLVQNSEQYNAGTWLLAFLSISIDSAVAPNGTTTADLLYPSSSQAYCYVSTTSFSVVAGQTYTQSVYLKRSGFRWGIVDNMAGSPGAWFDLLNGVVGNVASGCTASIESVGNGWYRCSVSSVAPSSTNYADFRMSDSNGSDAVTANGTDGLYVWGFQINVGSNAKPYFPTTDRLNVPRLTYQNGGGGCPSLLLEKQSTNVLRNSEDFSQSTWAKLRTSITANAITSPDGTQNADKAIANTDNSDHSVFDNTITSTSPATLSIYAKAGEYNYIFLGYDNGSASQGAFFNLSNGTISQNTSTLTASIQSVGNGWYRCVVSSGTSNWSTIYSIIALSENGTSFIFAGDGSKGIYIWGAQAEQSSYPTSYIPTTSASATRVADACFKTGISSLIGQTEGVMFVDCIVNNYNTFSEAIPLSIFTSGGNINQAQQYIVFLGSISAIRYVIFDGSSVQCNISTSNNFYTLGNRVKIAAAYKNNDFVLYINGIQIGTDTSGTVSAMADLYLDYQASSNYVSQYQINEAVLFKTRLTNAELASLTTI
jgi:hypothetical protein